MAGRVRLDEGQIELLGEKLDGSAHEVRRSLGVVPQEIALYGLLTARENLEVFGKFHGLTGARLTDRVNWALAWTGLADRAAEPIMRYSGGMKRRLNIACGILHSPEVVLLDEPTVGVDPQSRERIWEMLDRLKASGVSLVLTTHQLDEAQTRGDRIVIIDHGKTIAEGTLAELIEQTVGNRRQITLKLDRPPQPPQGLPLDGDGRTLRTDASDVAAELPALLERVRAAGCQVEDIEIHSPTLQGVFLHLTGRELRE